MHVGNVEWLLDLNARYDIRKAKLLELGSLNINGTARDHLQVKSWVGIDRIAGKDVDIVCDAVHTKFSTVFGRSFSVLLCMSMLEHDPTWRDSLTWNLKWLKKGGLVFLSWGAEGNVEHDPPPWAPVPVADVVAWAADAGLETLEACWEYEKYTPTCKGCYDMVLRKVR